MNKRSITQTVVVVAACIAIGGLISTGLMLLNMSHLFERTSRNLTCRNIALQSVEYGARREDLDVIRLACLKSLRIS